MSIVIQNVSKSFGSFQALADINLSIETGELVALLGPSGSGKTSLLRIIAGLEAADQGDIYFHKDKVTQTHAASRQVGFVFQHYALFPHMTVADNISYGLRVKPRKERPSKKEIAEKVRELLALVKLEGMDDRYPAQLSGGQRQRIALARALAVEPKVLLLDEPFGALDAKVRKDLRKWLRKLHNEFQVTSVFVTHDQEEALDVSDRVVVMNQGKIEQVGSPDEVYEQPKSPFVYDFLGNVNVFTGRVKQGFVQLDKHQLKTPTISKDIHDQEAVVYTRPHHMEISRKKQKDAIPAVIEHIHMVGPIAFLELNWKDDEEVLQVELAKDRFHELDLKKGETVFVVPKNLTLFFPEEFTI
ncbi:sulfate/molybdate ABC transporter ATP-binding protein [Halalkalibacterium halodurans]|uniref:Sulfate/thiosulfate import ATP-binding protein CysA n=1 Tax=Halalkalibacterium halodurans (strain ATCC BAA-125 / DSM 18197 / FERM 7344 / JCM 9153 / C-125) TaxID=272558 RepID=CYSA_HALH5|nr:sulfate/molybdate ABC transporter ATP-binding protein [Halalkalibacterium halodurans]Q9K876.1 RecName: Full=Sulfate/thiosulfate import ATP-binding protein CysA; AltName: Full=Sulfate-transporting ATPase [Halalkalibacterium halodurans C-125]MED4082113.1 sulfate/molybdate ABC transporter ATP-binding protein [Halalkalibacterium halodurans]MED4084309.1 sulfate/molybdate ABC transporter ATP-binding protein [Halalkalibacterium halodurans]MED4103618.1 sulfate/molybdate ABC transporter ATP-binding p